MLKKPDYVQAQELLLVAVLPVEKELLALPQCGGRILAQNLIARENVPSFDRSPYDGYALRAADTANAAGDNPVTLRILEEIPAGAVPTKAVTPGTAAKVLTGAPIPEGADAVIMYEKTVFTEQEIRLFGPVKAGDNIVRTGEDIRKGSQLAPCGSRIDAGLAGTLAAQGVSAPLVYKRLKVGILSTGNELVEAEQVPAPGKIRNSNRHVLETVLKAMGCESVYLGIAGDSAEEISALMQKGLACCDALISTGGVSAGDYDLTPDAMALAGVKLLFRGVDIKPGMACAYGVYEGKPVCALSGNPASALTNFYALAQPALRRRMGCREPLPRPIQVTLINGFAKKSPKPRFLRGRLNLKNGVVCMELPKDQGNVVLSSAIGCDVMAIVPAGSGPVSAGTVLKGFLLPGAV